MAECTHKEGGQPVRKREPMLEGCVFAIAPSKWELRACMRKAIGLENVLAGHPTYEALENGEETFIDRMAGPGNRTVEMSEGVVGEGGIAVVSGPLKGREGTGVHRVSQRGKWAYLDARIAGRPVNARVGLRVTRNASA